MRSLQHEAYSERVESMHFVVTECSLCHSLGSSDLQDHNLTPTATRSVTLGVHILETELVSFIFLNFHVAENRLYILLKLVWITLS